MKKINLILCFLSLLGISQAQWTNTYNGEGDFSDMFNAIVADDANNSYQAGFTINPDLSKDILVVKLNASGDTVWTRVFNGLGNGPDEATAITLDNSGNILITGYQKGSGTGYDIFTMKLSTAGNLLWTAFYNYTTNEFDQGNAIVTDNSGNVYVAGQSDKDVSLNNNDDYLVVKYNASGAEQWVKRSNGTGNGTDRPSAMVLDANNDLYVTGRSSNLSDDDYFTVKYNGATGAELWKKYFDRTHHDRATDIVCNTANGRIYVTGRSNNGDNYDYATICYDGAGTEIWQNIFDYVDDDRATHIGIDNSGNIYVTGQSDIDASVVGINYDILTVKYNSSGVQQFAQSFGGDAGDDDIPSGMLVDDSGNIFICGSSDNNASTTIENDIVVLKYNSAGTIQWSTLFNTPTASNDVAKGIALDAAGNILITGYSENIPDKNATTIKLNSSGDNTWDYNYNGIGDNADNVHAIIRDNSNNSFLAGYTFGYEQDRNFMVMKIGAAGTMHWKNTINGTSNTQSTDDAIAISTDNLGNVYAAGFVKNSGTGYDMMVVKYNSDGDSLWAQQYNYDVANETDKAIGIAIDATNNVYVTGRSDQDAGIISNDDILTLKYSSAGILLWEKRYNGTGNGIDNAKAIQISDAGNIYVAGKTFNGSDMDMVVLKYNSAGVQQWVKIFDGNFGDDEVVAITIDADENIYVSGNSTTSTGDLDATVLAYTAAGSLSWSELYDSGANGNDEAKSISLDNENNIIIGVTTSPDTIAATLNGDITVVKFDIDGNQLWDATYTNALNDDASEATVDVNNNIIITGQTDNGTAGAANYDYITLKYSPEGTVAETEVYNGTGNASDVANTVIAFENEIYVAGGSYGATSQRDIVTILYGTSPESINNNAAVLTDINIYPNPASAQFNIDLTTLEIPVGSKVVATITDVSGRMVSKIYTTTGLILPVNCSTLAEGIYLINIIHENQIITNNTIILN